MSARDDYPWLANRERAATSVKVLRNKFDPEVPAALDEIDRLRAEVYRLTGEVSAAAIHLTMALLPSLKTAVPGLRLEQAEGQ